MKFKIYIFFLFFTLSTKNLFLLDLNFGINFLNHDHFKCGCSLGLKTFDEKLGFQKKLGSFGFFVDVLEICSFNSFYVTSHVLFEVGDLQKISYIGVNCSCSFRPWTWPINIGININYLKFRPKLSFGFIICFNYHRQRLNINFGTGLLYTKTKNVNCLFNDCIPKNSCINFLNENLLGIIRKNKNKLLDNDEYFYNYNQHITLEIKLNEIIEKVEKLVFLKEKIAFKDLQSYSRLIEDFNRELLQVEKRLKKMFKIVKESGIKVKYFTSENVKIIDKLVTKINEKIEYDEEDYDSFVSDLNNLKKNNDYKKHQPEFNLVQYLKNRVLKIFCNLSYFVEIKDKDLDDRNDKNERESILN